MCEWVCLGQIRFLRFVVPGDYQGEALEPHKTGQVDIMYTFQFVAPVQVQGR